MKLGLNTNIGSLTAQNQLLKASEKLQTSFERLSSGLRINRASDDPAGRAMASGLQTDSRLMAQAVRNVNDGISLLTVAESALKELNSILGRQAELAQQAANGTYSFEQRMALHQEANSLVEEYNRIINTTEFNGRKLLNRNTQDMNIQAGINSSGKIDFTLTDDLARVVGDGTLSTRQSYADGARSYYVSTGDVNGDGFNDVVSVAAFDNVISIYLNNGDGTLGARTSYDGGAFPTSVILEDVNNDGILDILATSGNDSKLNVLIGNSNGTFINRVSYSAGGGANGTRAITSGDFNADGFIDLATASASYNSVNIFINNGDGTFTMHSSIATGDYPNAISSADLNNDGVLDLIHSTGNDGQIHVHLGTGNGNFSHYSSFDGGVSATRPRMADFNSDGILDLLWGNSNPGSTFRVALGNGNGSFKAETSYYAGINCGDVKIADLNGDGVHDLIAHGAGENINPARISFEL